MLHATFEILPLTTSIPLTNTLTTSIAIKKMIHMIRNSMALLDTRQAMQDCQPKTESW